MVRFNSFEKFTISSKPVTADYIHAGVFVPVFNLSEGVEKFTFSPLGNGAAKLMYWDEQAWVSELAVSSVTPKETVPPPENQVRSASDRAAAAAENEGLLKETEANTLMVIDRTGAFTVLEQSSCRAARRQTRNFG